MASSINASLSAGLVQTADTSGIINLQSGGTTIVAVSSTGAAVTGTLSSTGNTTLGDASTDTLNVGNGGLVKDASGNVGIGTASPTALLHVQNTNDAAVTSGLRLFNAGTSTGTGDSILFTVGTGQTTAVITGASSSGTTDGYLAFSTRTSSSATEKMRIDASGNLLVGKTTAGTGGGNGIQISQTSMSYVCSESSGGSGCYEFYSSNIGAYRFYVTSLGTVFATNTTITAISDQRLKENVRDLDCGLNKILALQPRRFDWKEGKGLDKKDDVGFIAQEFETVFPQSVVESKAGEDGIEYKALNHSELIPTLVKAIQEQQALITSLTARLDEQQAQISVLQGAK